MELTYSAGVPNVYVPDIRGLSKNDAENVLKSQGFAVKFSNGDYSDNTRKGKVLKQVPAAGSSVSNGSTVTAYLSKGSEQKQKEVTRSFKVTVRNSGTLSADGTSTIEPLHVQIYYTDAKHDNAVFADEMIAKTKTYHLKFIINPNETASYKVLINGQSPERRNDPLSILTGDERDPEKLWTRARQLTIFYTLRNYKRS
ncbi:PASTA domain-containing protein [Terrilactibacillus sp. S3-3]|nr:PASTA domain-containing protein [Terrilactibacillus sp. S3-3]